VAVEEGGEAYVAGYVASSSGDKSDDKVVVSKVRKVKLSGGFCFLIDGPSSNTSSNAGHFSASLFRSWWCWTDIHLELKACSTTYCRLLVVGFELGNQPGDS